MAAKNFKILGFILAAAVFTMAAASGAYAADNGLGKIVTVNINQIVEKHPAFIEAQQTLQGEAQKMREDMEGKNEQEQQQMQQQLQQQMQQRSQQLQQEALEKVRNDVQEIADEKGYDLVMDANALFAGGEDVTDEVMEAIEEKSSE
ncbi:MAG: OmpH family outer membrane protein [Desulfobacterales bacterium]